MDFLWESRSSLASKPVRKTLNWSAFGEVLPQAVAMALSPIPIVLVILVLVSPRARVSGPAFAVGWFVGLFALTSLAFVLADGAGVGTESDATDGANLVQLGLGGLFILFAFKQWQKRPRPGLEPKTPKIVDAIDSMGPLKVLGVGFGSAAANPKNIPLGASAGVAMAQASAGTGGLATVLGFAFAASSTVIVAVLSVLVLGDRTREPLNDLKTWLLQNASLIMVIIFILLAAKMIGSGLALGS